MQGSLRKALVVSALAAISVASVQAKSVNIRPAHSAKPPLCSRALSSTQTGPSTGEFSGSLWNIDYEADGEAARSYEIRLLPDGTMLNNHPNDSTPDNDRWESKGRYVLLRFNDSYVVYSAVLNKANNLLRGQAVNQVGDTWKWTARRLPNCKPS